MDTMAEQSLALPGVVSETALTLPEGLTLDDWTAAGAMLGRIGRACQWWIGDWLNYGERRYGETYAQGIEATGYDYATLQNFSWVAARIEMSRRRDILSWSHHREIAALDPADQAARLDQAEAETLSVHALRREIKDDQGDEWYTPRWLLDALGLTYDLDVCAPADPALSAVAAHRHYTAADDGLAQPWTGTVWCNPPYSQPGPWAQRSIEHADGLLLTHIPMNAEWCADVWQHCDAIRLFQAIEFTRPDTTTQRPGYWLQLAAFGQRATAALAELQAPAEVAANPRRVPSPMWRA